MPNAALFIMTGERQQVGYGWRDFSKAQGFSPGMEIVFEFLDHNVNHALIWSCL